MKRAACALMLSGVALFGMTGCDELDIVVDVAGFGGYGWDYGYAEPVYYEPAYVEVYEEEYWVEESWFEFDPLYWP